MLFQHETPFEDSIASGDIHADHVTVIRLLHIHQEGQLNEAVSIRRSCLDFAELSGDESLQWSALHSLGLTLKEMG